MCLTLPGRVVALGPDGARIRCGGGEYRATTLLVPGIAVGDYVLVQAGMVLERLTPEDAAAIAEALDLLLGAQGASDDPIVRPPTPGRSP